MPANPSACLPDTSSVKKYSPPRQRANSGPISNPPESLMKRSASAVWSGSLKEGSGTLTAPSGVLKSTPYSFGRRFGNDPGTNPEELIAAAHAGCFAMALSAMLGEAGFTPERLEATAEVSLENVQPG